MYFSDNATFSRLLTLLKALWENFSACYEDKCDFTRDIGLTDKDMWSILERVDQKYLNKDEENVVGKS